MTASDQELCRRFVADGDEAAFSTLVDRYIGLVFSACRRILGSHQDAEDAAQATFCVLAQQCRKLDASRPLAPWLHKVASNLAHDALRARQARERHHQEASTMPRPGATAELGDDIDLALGHLPERERSVIVLFHLEGHSLAEIAKLLEKPESTVGWWLQRGRDRLRSILLRRGVAMSGVAFVAALGALPAAEVPVGLVAATSKIAVGFAATGAAATPAAALALKGCQAMKIAALVKSTVLAAACTAVIGTAGLVVAAESGGKPKADPNAPLGSPSFQPTPERIVGWRGDWSGHFPGATPPTTWSRRVTGITNELRYQAAKPAGAPGKESRPLEYFTIKDWLIAGPFPVDDPAKAMNDDQLGGETTVQPAEGAKAGASTWKYWRADIATQSRHDVNGGLLGQTWVDFLYAYAKCEPTGYSSVTLEGDVTNKAAYAHTYIYAPQAGKARMHLPMRGAVGRFWLAGVPHDLNPKDGEKTFDVTFVQGWNSLLIKIISGKGTTPDGKEWRSDWMAAAYIEPIPPYVYETTNITWMTKMTGRSMSQPIVVGDRIYIGSGISDLMGIDKATGKVLWIGSNTPWEALAKADQDNVRAQVEPMIGQLEQLNAGVVLAINAVVSPQGMTAAQQPDLDSKIKAKNELERKIHDEIAKPNRKKFFPGYINEVSSSNATPCSDGTRIYWVCGGGMGGAGGGSNVIACWDLAGKRQWSYHESFEAAEHGNSQSLTYVDGKVIYGTTHFLIALDAKTGAVVWKLTNVPMGFATTPQVVRIGGVAVILSATKLVRVADGTEIADNLDTDASCTDLVDGDYVYNLWHFRGFSDPESLRVFKLPTSAAGKTKAEIFWDPPRAGISTPVRGACGYISGGLVVDGILYGVDTAGGLIAVDPQAKKGLYQVWLDGYNHFHRYLYGVCASPTLAGKTIYITDDAGYTHLLQPGPQFKELKANVIENIHITGSHGNPCRQESFYTSPYFEGKAMYLRGEEYLYCIEDKTVLSGK